MIKRKDLKKIASAFLTVTLLFGCFSYLFAIDTSAVTPRWESLLSVDLTMAFGDDGFGEVSGIAIKKMTATKIEGTVTLYKLSGENWIYIDDWYNSKTKGTLAVVGEFPCVSGTTYKAIFVVTAYTEDDPESFTVERIKVCP